ncbi:hypothetical protein BJP62_03905 [Jeongeupia sp. USM3]|nr:hypothetical protein BJP62_03905 [Jeongeupia sp. USM3]
MICFGIFLFIHLLILFNPNVRLGFFGHLVSLLVGSGFTAVGMFAGDSFRRFVHPDLIMARDSIDMLRKRVFWLVGPQAIGWFVGYLAYTGFMRNVMGLAM